MRYGVPQESMLGPLLFIICILFLRVYMKIVKTLESLLHLFTHANNHFAWPN